MIILVKNVNGLTKYGNCISYTQLHKFILMVTNKLPVMSMLHYTSFIAVFLNIFIPVLSCRSVQSYWPCCPITQSTLCCSQSETESKHFFTETGKHDILHHLQLKLPVDLCVVLTTQRIFGFQTEIFTK